MANEQTQLLSILYGFVQGVAPQLDAPLNAAAVLQSASQQNLLPVLAHENKQWGLFDDPGMSGRLETILYTTVAHNLNRCVSFEALSRVFSENGIAHMPVKGYYLRELYPTPEVRTFSDIDILIRPEDRTRTHELMLSRGFSVEHDWEPTYSYRRGAEHYELHTNLMDGNLDGRTDLQAYFSRAWDYAQPDEELRFRPAAEFHLVYMVCHLAKHLYGGGAGLRMYLDVALFVRQLDQTLDWNSITAEFADLQLSGFFCTVMNACRSWFGIRTSCPLPQADSAALEQLLEYTLDSDLFGHLRDHSVVRLRNTAKEKPSKLSVLRRMLFPPADVIASRYTFLQRRAWLLPVAWVVRFFSNLSRLPQQLRELRRVKAADPADVSSYDSFMKTLGL